MPRPARWTCPACRQILGQVTPDGTLTVEGARVVVPSPAIVVVVCPGCSTRRRWESRPPGFAVKAAV